jgi:hypothetical protein
MNPPLIFTCQKQLAMPVLTALLGRFSRVFDSQYLQIYCVYLDAPARREDEYRNVYYFDHGTIEICQECLFLGADLYHSLHLLKKSYESMHDRSYGWHIQQLCKLAAPLILDADVLVFDSDTIPMCRLPTFLPPYNIPVCIESNSCYSALNEILLGSRVPNHTRHIAQHMYFSRGIVHDLRLQVEKSLPSQAENCNWLLGITRLSCASASLLLSEYELYASFAALNYDASFFSVRLARHGGILIQLLGRPLAFAIYKFLKVELVATEEWSRMIHILEPVWLATPLRVQRLIRFFVA